MSHQNQEDERRRWVAEIRASIEQGRAESVLIPADRVFDHLQQKYRSMAESGDN